MKSIIIFLSAIVLIGCNRSKHESDIVKLQLIRSGSWNDFGAAIAIDSALNYVYYSRNLKQGYFAGKISPALWDSLEQKLSENKFRTLKSDPFARTTADGQYYNIIVYWKDGRTQIDYNALRQLPKSVTGTFRWLNDSYKKVRLHRLSHPVKFEATFQNLPPLSSDSANFIPPLLDK
jgi:hypothetical protein